jgi:hypothetical protein
MASGAVVCGLGVDEQEVNARRAAGINIVATNFIIVFFMAPSPFWFLVWFCIPVCALKFPEANVRHFPGPHDHGVAGHHLFQLGVQAGFKGLLLA